MGRSRAKSTMRARTGAGLGSMVSEGGLRNTSTSPQTELLPDSASATHYHMLHELPPVLWEDSLPYFDVKAAPLTIDLNYPCQSKIGNSILVTVTITNHTSKPHSVSIR